MYDLTARFLGEDGEAYSIDVGGSYHAIKELEKILKTSNESKIRMPVITQLSDSIAFKVSVTKV